MSRASTVAAAAIAALVAGCGLSPDPSPDPDAPPTSQEIAILGPQAHTPWILAKFRDCSRFASVTTCKREIFGGGGGFDN
jgi:hypothetical protein